MVANPTWQGGGSSYAGPVRVLVAPDKFRGTATAAEAATALAEGCRELGHDVVLQPLADGGEGTLEVLGGPNRTTTVTGPLGDPVEAPWRLAKPDAVIEMAAASGLELVGGAEGNDPVAASTYGTGELIAAALGAGARRIVVGVGCSATTDGGLGALTEIAQIAAVILGWTPRQREQEIKTLQAQIQADTPTQSPQPESSLQ